MASIWLTSIAARYRAILEDLATGLRTCPDELWDASLYPLDPADRSAWTPIDPEGRPFDDEAVVNYKRRTQGAVWRTASHTLFFTDADLSAMEQDWIPRTPLSPHDEDENVVPPSGSSLISRLPRTSRAESPAAHSTAATWQTYWRSHPATFAVDVGHRTPRSRPR